MESASSAKLVTVPRRPVALSPRHLSCGYRRLVDLSSCLFLVSHFSFHPFKIPRRPCKGACLPRMSIRWAPSEMLLLLLLLRCPMRPCPPSMPPCLMPHAPCSSAGSGAEGSGAEGSGAEGSGSGSGSVITDWLTRKTPQSPPATRFTRFTRSTRSTKPALLSRHYRSRASRVSLCPQPTVPPPPPSPSPDSDLSSAHRVSGPIASARAALCGRRLVVCFRRRQGQAWS
jgi:hypothetical protein